MKHNVIKNLALSAMFIAVGLTLPFLTGQIPQIGSMMLPLHIPVLLCGLICGWKYGVPVGIILPLLRYVMFGMPPIFPVGIAMAFEMATYALVAGFLYENSRWKCIVSLYRSMILAMLAGRIVWGIVMTAVLGVSGGSFTWQMFMAGAFLNAIPGIILQLILIPAIMVALNRAKLVKFSDTKPRKAQTDSER